MHSQKFQQNFWRNYKWTYLYLCTTDNFYYYEREVHIFNWQGLGGWTKSIPHIVLVVVHLHNLHAKPVNYDNNNNRLFPGLAFINMFYKNFGQIFSSHLIIFESVTMQLRLISHRKINKLNTKKNSFNKTASKIFVLDYLAY